MSNPKTTSTELQNLLKTSGVNFCGKTVGNFLNSHNYHGRRPRHKPLLKKVHKQKRLEFAREHINKPLAFFNNILWSDETKVELFRNTGPQFIWREEGKALEEKSLIPTTKHGGGSVMVWSCFSTTGTGELYFIDGRLNAAGYQTILQDAMLPSARKLIRRNFLYQQDNDPKHTAKSTKEFFRRRKISVLEWPSQSPDLNPIDMLWHDLRQQ
jgi:hypothetical protein